MRRVTMPTAGRRTVTAHPRGRNLCHHDHAFGIAGNLDEVEETGLSAHIRYFSPPAGGRLSGRPQGRGTERTSVYAVDVSDGRPVASFGIGSRSALK